MLMETKLNIDGVLVDELGLSTKRTDFTEAEIDSLLAYVGKRTSCSLWMIADMAAILETVTAGGHGSKGVSKYAMLSQATGKPIPTLMQYARTSRIIQRAKRYSDLSFSHHMVAAASFGGDLKKLFEFLDTARRKKLGSSALSLYIRSYKKFGEMELRVPETAVIAKLWRKQAAVQAFVDEVDTLSFGETADALAALNLLAELYHKLEARYLFLQNAADGQQEHVIENAIQRAEKKRGVKEPCAVA